MILQYVFNRVSFSQFISVAVPREEGLSWVLTSGFMGK